MKRRRWLVALFAPALAAASLAPGPLGLGAWPATVALLVGGSAVGPASAVAATAEEGGNRAEGDAGKRGQSSAGRSAPDAASMPGKVRRPVRARTRLPAATDLSPRPGVRQLVLFSVTDCPWCEIVRARHLRFRVGATRGDTRIAVSEVMIDRDDPLIGPDGQSTTGRALARRLGVKVGPTVMAFDAAGQPVGEPIVGALLEDFYDAFLDRLVDQAAGAPLQ